MLIGFFVRTVTETIKGQKLDDQKDGLQELTQKSPLELVPEWYRPCAALTLQVARYRAGIGNSGAGEIRQAFEQVREKGRELHMESASKETATRKDVLQVLYTLKDYATESQASIDSLDAETKRQIAALVARSTELEQQSVETAANGRREAEAQNQWIARTETGLKTEEAARKQATTDLGLRMHEMQTELRDLRAGNSNEFKESRKRESEVAAKMAGTQKLVEREINRLHVADRKMRKWIVVLGVLSLAESAAIIYRLAR